MSDIPEYVRGPGLKTARRAPQGSAAENGPAPCPWPASCRCTHLSPCVAGWIDSEEDGRPVTRPCPNCRPEAHRTLSDPMLTRAQAIAKLRQRKER